MRGRLRAAAVALLLIVTTLVTLQGSIASPAVRTLFAQQVPSVHGSPVPALARPADLTQGGRSASGSAVVWPSGVGEADLRVPTDGGDSASRRASTLARVRAGTLPVWLGPAGSGAATPDKVRVSVVDRASLPAGWRNGVVLRLSRVDGAATGGRASMAVDYRGFAGAFGADWSTRLRLVQVPGCALVTPDAAGCAAVPLASRNDAQSRQVSADVAIAGAGGVTTLALTSAPSGSAGDFGVSSLQASSTWLAGGNTGTFTFNYPADVPPSLAGPAPKVSFAYSSGTVDGRSQASNNQPSWVGEGFDWWPGYIERRYASCADDMGGSANNTTATGDECWGTDNATLSLNGSGGQLIKDDTNGSWHLTDDDNSTVEHLTGAVNGDNNNEYWKITTADGTQYFFGLNRLPGYTGTTPADKTTNSTWTVPVAGNNPGEDCHAASFIGSFCTQAWRWNLDYVVDPHGNTMSLFYNTETNLYGRNNSATDVVSYVRGGWVDHIDYGTDDRSGTDTENTSTAAPMRVTFTAGDRCLSSCATHDAAHWPDTPWDQNCAASPCTGLNSPTYWITKRLATVTTQVWNATGSAYKNVNTWTLTHNFPDPGDGTRAGLWLESIVRTGVATGTNVIGGSIAMPETNFDWVQMPNRVDTTTDGKFPMNWMRMSTIWTDTGAKIDVRYMGADCVAGTHMPASPQANTLRCYPVLEKQPGGSITTEYFHKYPVTSVTEADRTGGSPDVVTSYEYVGAPAWRHTDDDGITKDELRTWSDYRGYAQVNTRVGTSGTNAETLTEASYFRGMNGDLDGSGGTRSVTMPAIDGNGDGDTADVADAPALADENAYSGLVRQTAVFNGVESAPVSSTISEPFQSAPTATRNMGQTTVYSRHVGTKIAWDTTVLAAGGRRVTRSDSSFDSYGMPTQVDDQGDVAVSGDEQCVKTTYNRNTASNLLTVVGRVETYALRCGTAPTSEADVVSDTRTSFDGQAYGTAPTKGDATTVEVAKAWNNGSVWLTQSTASADAYGRVTDVTDARGNHTTTAYTPASGGPVTSVATTTPLGTTATTMEPSWGTATAVVDMNNKRTEATFDALGRTSQIWLANHTKASFPSAPNSSFTYLVRNSGGVNAVTAAQLNAASTPTNAVYTTTYTLYDGLLRARQTQSASMANGHTGTVFMETKYDDHGQAISQSQHFDSTVQPGTTLFTIADWQPKTQTATVYDRAGRATASVFNSSGSELWRTTTSYGGDRVNVTPPIGGTATTTIIDAHGRSTELRQYHNPADVGSNTRSLYDLVSYHFDRKGRQDSVTDNAGNTWTSTVDLLGRQTAGHDPDKGDSSATYNDAGDALTSTDGRGQTLAYTYDSLGRKTGEYTGSVATANKLATFAFDPPGFKGQLASSSRWLNNGTDEYKVKVRSYTPTYQSTGEDYIIPATLTGLSGTYTISRGYTASGSPSTLTYPAGGGLNGETVTTTYDPVTGLPEQLQTNTGVGQYVSNTDYTAYGELTFVQYQMLAGSWLQRSFTYDDVTHRLSRATSIRQTTPQAVDDIQYTYAKTGDITKIADSAVGGATDTQCFGYDYGARLTDAWTPTSGDCSQAKSAAALGGPAPYWQSWTFDSVGDRKTQTVHATGGDTTTTYNYPTAGSAQPHALSSATTGATTLNYQYDLSGNTTCRPTGTSTNACPPGTGSQTLTWDPEGRLGTVTDATGTSSYTYTADGTRLIADDAAATTLYLPNVELKRVKSTGAVTANRYYTWAGQTCAMKTTGGAVTWLLGDHQNTQAVAVAAGNQTITNRQQFPYGASRGTSPTWPDMKGFVNGDKDPTGLTHIGARDYDPTTGRFVSVDPVFESKDPSQLIGYGYAGNSPVSHADPTGLCRDDPGTPCGDGHLHDGNGLDGPWIPGPAHQCGVCGPVPKPPAKDPTCSPQTPEYCHQPGQNDLGAHRLFFEWVAAEIHGCDTDTVACKTVDYFRDGDPFTEDVRMLDSINNSRADIAAAIAAGKVTGPADWHYAAQTPDERHANAWSNVWSIITDGNEGMPIPQAFIGSYDMKWEIVGYEKDGSPVVEFNLTNASTKASAKLDPGKVQDYGPDLSAGDGHDAAPGEHYIYQSFRWRETFPGGQAPPRPIYDSPSFGSGDNCCVPGL